MKATPTSTKPNSDYKAKTNCKTKRRHEDTQVEAATMTAQQAHPAVTRSQSQQTQGCFENSKIEIPLRICNRCPHALSVNTGMKAASLLGLDLGTIGLHG